jgi:hypothetical protein
VPFRARIGRNFAFVPRLGLRLYRFKVLKTLIFYAISELALGEFPVYKNSRVDRVMSYSAKNLIFSSHLEGHGRLQAFTGRNAIHQASGQSFDERCEDPDRSGAFDG